MFEILHSKKSFKGDNFIDTDIKQYPHYSFLNLQNCVYSISSTVNDIYILIYVGICEEKSGRIK